ncbi:PhnB protein [Glaciihabitans tibetensis]|uniref:PhnB protein n=1 Tax=Glaciihabitans tibetensis TaxID=1266600 RepID=A0A2T0VE74_9MICO|nr:VOC family protein [Glaciihabitans tibetensis]PRY68474.1 PhnB protein [Glaciihabitans tibetensis]
MTVRLNPYLSFRDNARDAIEFYHSVFGGELDISTFGEMNASEDPSEKDKVMHSVLTTPTGLALMASDTPNAMDYTPGDSISVSLSGDADDQDVLTGYYNGLVDGGTVTQPLVLAPWGDYFGMCQDKFGVNWLVNIAGEQSAPQ